MQHVERRSLEALGFGPRDKLLILHADDVGMCHSVNEASFERLGEGYVSSASLMAPCPWILEATEFFSRETGLDVGVHSTLTSEWRYYKWRPLTMAGGLCRGDGFMWASVEEVAARATASEVEAELSAQVRFLADRGVKLTHLDTHMGTVYARPDFLESYLRVASASGILPMVPRLTPEVEAVARSQGLPVEKLRSMTAGVPVQLDALLGLPSGTLEEKRRALMAFLAGLRPGSISQVIVHLGLDTYELKAIIGEGYKERYFEYMLVKDPDVRAAIDRSNVHLVGWKDLLRLAGMR